MPIEFRRNDANNYFESRFTGLITPGELRTNWRSFMEDGDWVPGSNELADLSEADLSELAAADLRQLAQSVEEFYRNREIESVKVAVFAPDPLPFGMARMYAAFAEESAEVVRIFRERDEAERWLTQDAE